MSAAQQIPAGVHVLIIGLFVLAACLIALAWRLMRSAQADERTLRGQDDVIIELLREKYALQNELTKTRKALTAKKDALLRYAGI